MGRIFHWRWEALLRPSNLEVWRAETVFTLLISLLSWISDRRLSFERVDLILISCRCPRALQLTIVWLNWRVLSFTTLLFSLRRFRVAKDFDLNLRHPVINFLLLLRIVLDNFTQLFNTFSNSFCDFLFNLSQLISLVVGSWESAIEQSVIGSIICYRAIWFALVRSDLFLNQRLLVFNFKHLASQLFKSFDRLLCNLLCKLFQRLHLFRFLCLIIEEALFKAFKVNLIRTTTDLVLNRVDLLLNFAQPVIQGCFHLGRVEFAALGDLWTFQYLGSSLGSGGSMFVGLNRLNSLVQAFHLVI